MAKIVNDPAAYVRKTQPAGSAISSAAGAASGAISRALKVTAPAQTNTPSSSSGYGVVSSAPDYSGIYDQLAALLKSQKAEQDRLRQTQIQQGVNSLESQRAGIGQSHDAAAQQAYIQYRQSQQALPEQMAALGYGGSGLTESSLVGLDANYGNNLNALTMERDNMYTDLDNRINDLRLTGDIGLAQNAIDYDQRYYDLLKDQLLSEANAKSSYAYSGSSSGGGTSSKPNLTYAQALAAYENGNTSPAVSDALDYYTPGWDYDGNRANTVYNQIVQFMNSDRYKQVQGYNSMPDQQNIADALYQYMQTTGLTKREAEAIANQFGFSLG